MNIDLPEDELSDEERAITDEQLRADFRAALDEVCARGPKPAQSEPGVEVEAAYAQAERLSEFLRLCRNAPKQIEAWLSELETMNSSATSGVMVRSSFQPVYWEYLATLSQQKEVDLRDAAQLRGLLVPKEDNHLARGLKVLHGGIEGHRKVYGTKKEKVEKRRMYQEEVIHLRRAFPHLSFESLCARASKKFGVHRETVKRYVKKVTTVLPVL